MSVAKFWLKHPGQGDFEGPHSLDEIRDGLEGGSFSWAHVLLEARGQSLGELRGEKDWQTMERWIDPETMAGGLPVGEPYRSEAEKLLIEVKAGTAYPKVRRMIDGIEGFLWVGIFIRVLVGVITAWETVGVIPPLLDGLVFALVVLAVFFFFKHILLVLLDIADVLLRRR